MSMIQQNAEPAGASRAGATGVTPVGSRYAAASVTGALLVILVASGPLAAGAARVAAVTALYGLVAVIIGLLMRRTYPHDALGLCNLVTLLRLALATCLVAPLLAGGQADWAVFAVAAVALGLDGLDGWLARRQGLVSAFGARFDMEVDAALGLILALNALAAGSAGALVLLLGVPRYAFVAAGLALPWMRRPLPNRAGRKVACVVQIAALIAVQAPILPPGPAGGIVTLAVLGLGWSFGRDVLWLWRRRS
ncbi:CDP-alcohol phosphatidyltransferase family protein [Roseovarius sp. SYSU LYC5161]|uniref:CDP-alcohol phosphatidyltransferase family protein n=1 Tax=Roseovarius halophilus (ex Wu et al. 2025) TaxID=3376060 RepID=UPI00399C496E